MRNLTLIAVVCCAFGCAEETQEKSSDYRTDETLCETGYECKMLKADYTDAF